MDESAHERPRAFYPEFAKTYNGPGTTPGWDLDGPERRMDDGRTLARAMGWLSFGLGAVELAAPGKVAELLGLDDRHSTTIRAMGLREMASGAGIMAQRTPAAGVWSRVAGDALDLAALTVALGPSTRRNRVLAAMGIVAGALALDALAAKQLTRRRSGEEGDRRGRHSRSFEYEGTMYHDVRRSTGRKQRETSFGSSGGQGGSISYGGGMS